nr:MAG TPA: hypothetical protein [Caudoviricetes sp.]
MLDITNLCPYGNRTIFAPRLRVGKARFLQTIRQQTTPNGKTKVRKRLHM